MKRSLWLLMLFLLAGHVPAASADSACEGRFVNPITDICWSCIFPLSLGSIKVSQRHLQQNGDAVWRRTGIKKHRLFVPESGNHQSFPGLCAELRDGGYLPEPQIYAGGADGLR